MRKLAQSRIGAVLCGEAAGAKDRARFAASVRALLAWASGAAAVMAGVYLVFGQPLAASFSTDPQVIAAARTYAVWAVVLPLAGVASFVFDGVFIGAAWPRAMLLSMAAALAVFLVALWLAAPLGNHGLWLAFSLFFVARGAGQALMTPRLMRTRLGRSAAGAFWSNHEEHEEHKGTAAAAAPLCPL